MLFALAFVCVISAASAVAPIWSPNTCGRSKYADAGDMNLPAGFIVGGDDARANEFPWQVSIRRKATNSHFCGGSIINSRWVLTAAHCIDGETASQISVVVGDHIRNAAINPARQTLEVRTIIGHENYNSRTMVNDIALLQTSLTIDFNVNVAPVCAPDAAVDYTYRKSQCSGWGTLSSGGACCPQTLQYVTLNITTNAFCGQAYGAGEITADMICASDNTGGRERDSCQGDSGGPLTIKESNGTFRIVGVVSWGIGCASGYPGVYARVTVFNNWISGKIGA